MTMTCVEPSAKSKDT